MMKYTNSFNGTAVKIISVHKFVTCLVYCCMVVINIYQKFKTVFLLDFVIAITIYIYKRARKHTHTNTHTHTSGEEL